MKRKDTHTMINLRDPASIRARRPLLVAHRGGVITPDAPENSLAAIRLAAAHGYDMVELDVREARDEEPVLFHGLLGSRLDIDCGVERAVEELTSQELAEIRYRASDETIPTLDRALALCRSLHLGVMLDLKPAIPSRPFLQRVAALVEEHHLDAASVTIEQHPLAREVLAGPVIQRVSPGDFQRAMDGEVVSLQDQFWFGWAAELSNAAAARLQQNGAFILVSINSFHYPAHAHAVLAQQDIQRLLAAGVDGFQIDSVYGDFLVSQDWQS
jgi:glycerophosphoryl diester phosphodiesterase